LRKVEPKNKFHLWESPPLWKVEPNLPLRKVEPKNQKNT
jgi:hypothetical protein